MAKETIELKLKEQTLIRSLREQPELLERFEAIVALTQTDEGRLLSADEVEELLIQEVRDLGRTTMEQWAKGAEERVAQDFKEKVPKALVRKKITLKWFCVFGAIKVIQRLWKTKDGKGYQRPLGSKIGVEANGYSKRMCRVIGDFGTEHSYCKARERIIEHYGIEIAPSAIRGVTMEVAEQCTEHLRKQYDQDYRKLPSEGKEVVIAQIDGSMVCVVEAGKREANRPRVYREIRLAMAVAHEEVEPHYAATFESVQEIGRRWGHCALLAGRGLDSKMHVIADGAPWIEIQNREVFGTGRSLLFDF